MSGAPWLGGLALVVSGLGYDLLLAQMRRVDHAFPSTNPSESTWWFGYARDLTNVAGALAYGGSFVLLGYEGSLALLAGGGLALVTYGLDYLLSRVVRVRRPALALAGAVVGLGAASAGAAGTLAEALRALLALLF